jgi:hypothetical protein
MSKLNAAALRHPRTQWEIEAAMWRAIKDDFGIAVARNADFGELLTVIHVPTHIPAFYFFRNREDVTAKVLPILRAQA